MITENKEYVNIQTKEKLDMKIIDKLKDNAMLKVNPHLFNEWDFEKNNKLDIYKMTKGSDRFAWWICSKCESSFERRIEIKGRGQNCPYCAGKRVNHTNSLATLRPDLMKEWSENNTINPHEITCGSPEKALWICKEFNEEYPMSINKKSSGRGCSICSGYYVTKNSSFGGQFPELAKEWHPTKNGELTPYDVSYGSGQKVWFLCNACTEDYDCSVDKKTSQNAKCPFCRRLRIGRFNNLQYTHPEVAKLWDYEKNKSKTPSLIVSGSNDKFWWKCESCEYSTLKSVNGVVNNGLGCAICSDGKSLGEKAVYEMLSNANIEFIAEKVFSWSKMKRYDYYFPVQNCILEIHGEQHEDGGFEDIGGRSLHEEQENDRWKEKVAKENGIEHYIIVKYKSKKIKELQESIKQSRLLEIVGLSEKHVDNIEKFATFNVKPKSWKLWNTGKTVKQISLELGLSVDTIRRYLKLGTEINKCQYPTKRVN